MSAAVSFDDAAAGAKAEGGGPIRLKEYFGTLLELLPSWSLIRGVSIAVRGGGRAANPARMSLTLVGLLGRGCKGRTAE